jgi:hypothetical protein
MLGMKMVALGQTVQGAAVLRAEADCADSGGD